MRKVILAVSEVTRAWFLETWLSLTKDYAKFEARFSCQRTCNSRVTKYSEPLLRRKEMIPQNVTLGNTWESKYKM